MGGRMAQRKAKNKKSKANLTYLEVPLGTSLMLEWGAKTSSRSQNGKVILVSWCSLILSWFWGAPWKPTHYFSHDTYGQQKQKMYSEFPESNKILVFGITYLKVRGAQQSCQPKSGEQACAQRECKSANSKIYWKAKLYSFHGCGSQQVHWTYSPCFHCPTVKAGIFWMRTPSFTPVSLSPSHVWSSRAALEFGESFRWRFCQRWMARPGKQHWAGRKPGMRRHESVSSLRRRDGLFIALTLSSIETMQTSDLTLQEAKAAVSNLSVSTWKFQGTSRSPQSTGVMS